MTFFLMAAGFAAGLLARKTRWIGVSTPQLLNTFIINLALPAMILLKVPSLVLDANAFVPVVAAWLVILCTALILWVLAKVNRWPAKTLGALLLVVPLTNSAYLGLPLLNALTNDAVVAYGALYDQFGNFFALAIYAPVIVAVMGGERGSRSAGPGLRDIVLKIIAFTPFPVLLIAVLFMSADTLPAWTVQPLSLLASTMGPLAAFIVGYSLRFSVPVSLRGPLIAGLVVRLLIAPMMVWTAAGFFQLSAPAVTASVLQAAMPCMITAGLVGIAAGFSERLIVAMLGLSTLLSVFTLGGLFWVLG